MGNIKLLDCTLRDGGYLNDWEFGYEVITNIYERLVSTKVDVIEVGFLDDSRAFDINRCIMPDTASVEKIFGTMDRGEAIVVGMIDYGTCDIKNIQPCEESYLDGIRVIFKEHLSEEALQYCLQIKELGYKVFAQLVSITSYTDESLVKLIDYVNQIEPYALSIVDTYGLLHQNNLLRIFEILDANLNETIGIGYHAHNNFQMGYANGISFLSQVVKRDLLVDGTLYGMGKSAGNTPLELLAMHLNDNFGKNYDVGQMLEAIENSIIKIQESVQWGYNLFYYVSAATKCHPNYVSYFMNKKTLSMKAINELLLQIDEDKKLLYDPKYAEVKYVEYQDKVCNDEEDLLKLQELFKRKDVLLIGPGKNIKNQQDEVVKFIQGQNCVKIAINYIPDGLDLDFVFLTNAKRYTQINSSLNQKEIEGVLSIATSNVVRTKGRFNYYLNYKNLIDETTEIKDNSLVMMLKLLESLGVKKIMLSGFDGYVNGALNYFNTNMEYPHLHDKAEYLNHYVRETIGKLDTDISVEFITHSMYENIGE